MHAWLSVMNARIEKRFPTKILNANDEIPSDIMRESKLNPTGTVVLKNFLKMNQGHS